VEQQRPRNNRRWSREQKQHNKIEVTTTSLQRLCLFQREWNEREKNSRDEKNNTLTQDLLADVDFETSRAQRSGADDGLALGVLVESRSAQVTSKTRLLIAAKRRHTAESVVRVDPHRSSAKVGRHKLSLEHILSQTEAARPYSLALARLITSSMSSNFKTDKTGPNTSSLQILMSSLTSEKMVACT